MKTAAELLVAHCQHTDGPPLNDAEVAGLLTAVPGWTQEGSSIVRSFRLADHYQTQAFTNAVMWVSHRQDHHPDLAVGYNSVRVAYSTHSAGGISLNDFICAARLNALFEL